MERKKQKIFAVIGGLCIIAGPVYDLINLIFMVAKYSSSWPYFAFERELQIAGIIDSISVIGLIVTGIGCIIQKPPVYISGCGIVILYKIYVMVGKSAVNFFLFLELGVYIFLSVIAVLYITEKGKKIVQKIWFVPAVLITVNQISRWGSYTVRKPIPGGVWITLLFDIIFIAGYILIGLSLKQFHKNAACA
ncbi:MAG: hypothetical protein J1F64_00475 [Oscillospiraceae bacterium]|nr:hypothetical protein [Oscillospiraceae bacterium]